MRFAFTRPEDGGLTIVIAAPKETLLPLIGTPDEAGVMRLSDEDYRSHVLERSIPKGVDFIELADDWQPPDDRTYRDAWVKAAGKVEVDMPKARNIHRDRLRAERAPKLAALDADYLKADEAGDLAAKARITAEKQALRDVTADPGIEAAKTPQELKAVIPSVLRRSGEGHSPAAQKKG